MTAKSSKAAAPNSYARTATVTYPYMPLSACVEVAKGVSEVGNGKQDVSRSLLASHLNTDEKSGHFAQKLASAKCYGLIEGRTEFRLSDLARGMFFPTQDPAREKRLALLEAAGKPGAFNQLLNRYDGSKMPTVQLMGNIVAQQLGIPESWKIRVATFFVKAMETAGAVTADGFLRHKSELEKVQSGYVSDNQQQVAQGGGIADQGGSRREKPPQDPTEDEADEEGITVWKSGKFLRVVTPDNMTKDLWDKLNRYVQSMIPNE